MKPRARLLKFLAGAGLTLALLVALFALFNALIPNLGATPAEVAGSLPGDELVTQPSVVWNHAATLNAPPEQVWPWLIQIGDTRAAYYSYTFIENLFAGYAMYNNANQVQPEWQNPPSGQGVIMDYLVLCDAQTNQYVLACSTDKLPPGFIWTWLWAVEPAGAGQSRLLVRHNIQLPAEMNSPAVVTALNLSGYVMEKGMIEGIRQRAEGRSEPDFIEVVDIGLWLAALAAGSAAGVLFVKRENWQWPLGLGLIVVVALFVLTYVQPVVWVRFEVVVALWMGVWSVGRVGMGKREEAVALPASR